MQITSEAVPPRQVRLTIVVPESRVDRAVHDVAQEIGKRLKVPGYRPGKIPLRAVIARLGDEESLLEEAHKRLAREAVLEAIEREQLDPSAPASVNVDEHSPFTLTAMVPLQPTVELGDFKGRLQIEAIEAEEVGEEDVEAVIERLRSDLAYLEQVERPAEAEDVVNLSLTGRTDDQKVVFDDDDLTVGLTESGVASAHLPDAVREAIVGSSAGDELAFDVEYPSDWRQPELQDEVVHFEARIKTVADIMMPEADDDFATQVSDVETIDELRRLVRSNLEKRAEVAAREEHANKLLDALVEGADIAYPPAVLDADTAELVADLQARVERQGIRFEKWLELQQRSADDVWGDLEQQARHRLERRLALGEFVRQEDITLAAEEIESRAERLRASVPPGEQIPSDDDLRRQAVSRLLAERALSHLVSLAETEPAEMKG